MTGSRFKFSASTGDGETQGFALSEARGAWTAPRPVKGLNAAPAVTCSAPGSCIVTGNSATIDSFRALVAVQAPGPQGQMRSPRGLATLTGPRGGSQIVASTCTAAGMCVVMGNYWTTAGDGRMYRPFRPFAVTERAGHWGNAQPIPGMVAFGTQDFSAIACDAAGTCTATGAYLPPGAREQQPFVISERHGVWGRPQAITPVPGGQTTNEEIDKISCASPGNCTAAGIVGDQSGSGPHAPLPLVVSERSGHWDRARVLPGVPVVHVSSGNSGSTSIADIACSAPDRCALAGYSASVSSGEHDDVDTSAVFVSSQVNGKWAPARAIPGLDQLRQGAPAVLTSMSCAAAGDCAVGGYYARPEGSEHPWLATQDNGTWEPARAVPGLKMPRDADGEITFISCTPGSGKDGADAGGCTAVGDYNNHASRRTPERFFATSTVLK